MVQEKLHNYHKKAARLIVFIEFFIRFGCFTWWNLEKTIVFIINWIFVVSCLSSSSSGQWASDLLKRDSCLYDLCVVSTLRPFCPNGCRFSELFPCPLPLQLPNPLGYVRDFSFCLRFPLFLIRSRGETQSPVDGLFYELFSVPYVISGNTYTFRVLVRL